MRHPLPSLKSAASGVLWDSGRAGRGSCPNLSASLRAATARWNRHGPSGGRGGTSRAPRSHESETCNPADRPARPEGPRHHRMLGTLYRHPESEKVRTARPEVPRHHRILRTLHAPLLTSGTNPQSIGLINPIIRLTQAVIQRRCQATTSGARPTASACSKNSGVSISSSVS